MNPMIPGAQATCPLFPVDLVTALSHQVHNMPAIKHNPRELSK
jgi:hypothetical protein